MVVTAKRGGDAGGGGDDDLAPRLCDNDQMKRLIPSLPAGPDLGAVMQRFPGNMPALLHLVDGIMVDDGPLHQGDRELIAAFVSALNACQYCTDSHLNAAEAFGVDPNLLTDLMKDVETAPVETPLKPLLKYIAKLTQTPARMTEADAEAVLAAGWSEEALFSAIEVCAIFSFMNRIVEGTGVSADLSAGRFVSEEDKAARRARRYTDWGRSVGLIE